MYSGFHWVQEHSCTCGTVSLEWTVEVPRVWREVQPFLTRSFLLTSSAPSPKRFKLLEVGMKWELFLFSRDSWVWACIFGSPFCFRFALGTLVLMNCLVAGALFQKRRVLVRITFCFITHIQRVERPLISAFLSWSWDKGCDWFAWTQMSFGWNSNRNFGINLSTANIFARFGIFKLLNNGGL